MSENKLYPTFPDPIYPYLNITEEDSCTHRRDNERRYDGLQ